MAGKGSAGMESAGKEITSEEKQVRKRNDR